MTTIQLIGRVFAGVAALGLLTVGLWSEPSQLRAEPLAPPSEEPARLDPRLPAYPGFLPVPSGRGLRVNGQLVDLDHFYTSDPADAVADFYYEALSRGGQGAYRQSLPNAEVTGTVTDDGRFLQVVAFPQEDGQTLVVPAVSSGPPRPGHEQSELGLPLPEQYDGLSTFASDDGGTHAVSATFTTTAGAEEMATFYVNELRRLGFRQLPGAVLPGRDDVAILRFQGPEGREVTVSLHDAGDAGSLVHLLTERKQ